jgi:hypothetical protein
MGKRKSRSKSKSSPYKALTALGLGAAGLYGLHMARKSYLTNREKEADARRPSNPLRLFGDLPGTPGAPVTAVSDTYGKNMRNQANELWKNNDNYNQRRRRRRSRRSRSTRRSRRRRRI